MSANSPPADAVRAIVEVFTSIDDPDTMQRFFEELFTPAERRDLALRWELMRRLQQGEAQRRIADALGISLCKITRGAKVLKDADSVSARWLPKDLRKVL